MKWKTGAKGIVTVSKPIEERIDDIFEDLIIGHNFDYAATQIKSAISKEIGRRVAEAKADMAQAYHDMGRHDALWSATPLPLSVLKVLPKSYESSTADVPRGRRPFMDFMLATLTKQNTKEESL
jgi:hypothetical protein